MRFRSRIVNPAYFEGAIANDDGPQEHLIALGYAGWAPGQLESELATGSWIVTKANASHVFAPKIDQNQWATIAHEIADARMLASLKEEHRGQDPSMN